MIIVTKMLVGNFNARVGNVSIPKIIGTFGESTSNDNGKLPRDFASFNRLKLTNVFFRKKDINKYTWFTREHRSLINYVIVSDKLEGQVRDTRAYRGYDIRADHFSSCLQLTRTQSGRNIIHQYKERK